MCPLNPADEVVVAEGERCAQASYVLEALGIEHRVVEGAGGSFVVVPRRHADRALREIEQYLSEPVSPRPAVRPPGSPSPRALSGALWWSLWMGPWWAFQQLLALTGRDPIRLGALTGDSLERLELHRPITALTLHTDVAHFLGNLVIGAFLLGALATRLGGPAATTAALAAALAANVAEAILRGPESSAVGASTAVFAAVGLLVSLRWRDPETRGNLGALLVPLGAGLALLAWFGTAGERTDVLGHVLGFLGGIAVGARLPSGGLPRWLAAVAWFGAATAWAFALGVSGR